MRVKLSYTVEEADVLPEVANLLSLGAPDINQCIALQGKIQAELRKESPDVPNLRLVAEMVEEYRKALYTLDIRLSEIDEMVKGYADYTHAALTEAAETAPEVSEPRIVAARPLPSVESDELPVADPHLGDLAGGD